MLTLWCTYVEYPGCRSWCQVEMKVLMITRQGLIVCMRAQYVKCLYISCVLLMFINTFILLVISNQCCAKYQYCTSQKSPFYHKQKWKKQSGYTTYIMWHVHTYQQYEGELYSYPFLCCIVILSNLHLQIPYMWPNLRKPDIMAHFWRFIFLYHCVLGTWSFVLE